jgi:hypothetical protein
MAIDHPRLQLLFNVIAITAFTSLTVIWYLRKKDRQTLANRMSQPLESTALPCPRSLAEPDPAELEVAEPKSPKQNLTKQSSPAPGAASQQPGLKLPAMNLSVRQTARRTQGWIAPPIAEWAQRGSGESQPSLPAKPKTEQKELAPSHGIVFPRQSPQPAAIQRLAGPVGLRRSVAAAKYRSLPC